MDWRILYNPLAALGRGKGFLTAMVVIIVLAAVSWWGWVHLDGALDLHADNRPVAASQIVWESLIAWLSLGLLLFAASKVFGGNGGWAAHLASVGLARFPYIFSAIVAAR